MGIEKFGVERFGELLDFIRSNVDGKTHFLKELEELVGQGVPLELGCNSSDFNVIHTVQTTDYSILDSVQVASRGSAVQCKTYFVDFYKEVNKGRTIFYTDVTKHIIYGKRECEDPIVASSKEVVRGHGDTYLKHKMGPSTSYLRTFYQGRDVRPELISKMVESVESLREKLRSKGVVVE